MPEMTSRERVKRMYEHREADRIPVIDSPWSSTVERWQREGMPKDASFIDFFGLDKFYSIHVDNSPRYPERVVEETEEYVTRFTSWGTTMRNWKHRGGVPEFLDFTIRGADSWAAAKARMTPSRDRIDWAAIDRTFKTARDNGGWITGVFWFGYDITASFVVGTENALLAMASEPEWISDMFNHELDVDIALYDMVWDAGYHFDDMLWYDDMGYKGTQFFSLDMYRNLVKPAHERACRWARDHGIHTCLHSCGNISKFIPDMIEIGVEMLNPVEVKSGLDPVALKKEYGARLGFYGALNAVLYTEPDKMWNEMRRVVPALKKNGGYIASSDHSVPETVSLEEFREFVRLAKELGSYH